MTADPKPSLRTIGHSKPAQSRLLARTNRINRAGSLMSVIRGKGDRRGQWAMTVNDRWRVCFEFRKGDAHNVEIVDDHKG